MQSLKHLRQKANSILFTRQAAFATKATRQLPIKDQSLKEHDPELYKLIEQEKFR